MPAKNTQLVKEVDQIDLSKANLALDLSSTDFDEESGEFHVSIDRAVFLQPLEIISKVLSAHGYELNLENLLACMDHLHIGVYARTSGKIKSGLLTAKHYLPTLIFRLPKKAGLGFALKKFYEEVGAYESAIAALSDDSGPKFKPTEKPGKLQETIDELKAENASLQEELSGLQALLQKALKSEESANAALESKNLLPSNLRLAVVKDIDLEQRSIVLKSGRNQLYLPISLAEVLPVAGDRCLLKMDQGTLKACYFYETKGIKLKPLLATIIHQADGTYKLATKNRRRFLITPESETEIELLAKRKTGDQLLIYLVNEKIIALKELDSPSDNIFNQVKLQLTAHDAEQEHTEAEHG